jgi:hypothetical protein
MVVPVMRLSITGLLKLRRVDRVDWRSVLLLEVGKTLAEREMAGQLDKAN